MAYTILALIAGSALYGLQILIKNHTPDLGRDIAEVVVKRLRTQETKPSQIQAPAQFDAPSVVPSQPMIKTERKPKTRTPTTETAVTPPLIGNSQFITYVVLYSDNSVLCGMDPLQFRHDACNDMSAAFKQHPHVNSEVVPELAKILQHYLVALVYSAGLGWGVMPGPVDGKFTESSLPPIDPPEFVKYPCGQIVDVSPTRNTDIYPFWFYFAPTDPLMKLPRDTKVSFLTQPSDEHAESYIARFDRTGYYRLDFFDLPTRNTETG